MYVEQKMAERERERRERERKSARSPFKSERGYQIAADGNV